jgi:hypothetical protein
MKPLPAALLASAIAALLVIGIVASCRERTLFGTLSRKNATISYSYDTEKTTVRVDNDGDTHVSHSGHDETTAHIRYDMDFLVDSKCRTLTAGRFSATVSGNHGRETAALCKLNENHIPPTAYTFGIINEEYQVKYNFWGIKEIVPMKLVPLEAK